MQFQAETSAKPMPMGSVAGPPSPEPNLRERIEVLEREVANLQQNVINAEQRVDAFVAETNHRLTSAGV